MSPDRQEQLRGLPAVGRLLEHPRVRQWLRETSHRTVVAAVQDAIAEVRRRILASPREPDAGPDAVPAAVLDLAEQFLQVRRRPSLRRVVNATGIVLHTGLGRAPLCPAAVEAITEAAGGYSNLEFELDTGTRGKRQHHVAELIAELTGAEAATVVNNNAAATLLILSALAGGSEVIVSRGQLVEIGGSYRLPAIMEASGARLREVGTTNRTRIRDYAAAISDETALLMSVHTSNYRIVGFTEETPISEIAELAHRAGLPALHDLGSGALLDLARYGLPHEPVVADSIAAGADLVCFSGDKLLGGPQGGIICGRRDLVQRLEAHPLMRAFRVGKLTLFALEATLRHYTDPIAATQAIPALELLLTDSDELAPRAKQLQDLLAAALPEERFIVCSDVSYAGGGSLPTNELETVVIQWRPAALRADAVAANLRTAEPPLIARVRDDAIILDLRTVRDRDFSDVVAAARHAVAHDA